VEIKRDWLRKGQPWASVDGGKSVQWSALNATPGRIVGYQKLGGNIVATVRLLQESPAPSHPLPGRRGQSLEIAIMGQQFLEGPCGLKSAMGQKEDTITCAHGTETMGNEQNGFDVT